MTSPLHDLLPRLNLFSALSLLFLVSILPAYAASPTITALTVTAAGSPVTQVPTNTAVTLTATVTLSGTPVTHGLVNFCEAVATSCTDVHILGSAALTASGSATWRFIPGRGAHSYKAVFQPTSQYASSTSNTASLSVSGKVNTATSIAVSGTPGNYTFTSTVIGAGAQPPTGTISFNDATNGNTTLASANLTANAPGFVFSYQNQYTSTASAIADVNGDGIPDIILGYHYTYPDGATCDASFNPNLETTDRAAIYLGNGNGSFTHFGTDFSVTCQPTYISVADFNSDGFPDLAFSSTETAGFTSNNVLFGDGAGNFARGASSDLGLLGNIFAADFNGDGLLDIASVTQNITLYLGDGAGNFTTKNNTSTTNAPFGAATGDFNSDGIPDIAIITPIVIGGATTQTIQLLLGVGDGTFTPSTTYPPISGTPQGLLAADFNNDGKADLAVSIFSDPAVDPNANSSSITVLTGDGAGNFTAGAPLVLQDPANANVSFAIGDFNNDGIADIAASPTNISTASVPPAKIFLGDGAGAFSAQTVTYASLPASVALQQGFAIGDLNGDGIPDLLNGNGYQILIENQSATATANSVATPPGSGVHQLFSSYPGDSNYAAATSQPFSLTTVTSLPVATISAIPTNSTSYVNSSNLVNITVAPPAGSPTPTGSVTLSTSGYTSDATPLVNGTAAITIPANALPVGADTLTAAYSGDSAYGASSSTFQITVTDTPPGVTLTPASPSITLSPGATTSNTVPITITSTEGLTGSVTLLAAISSSPAGAVNQPTVSFGSTSPVTLDGKSAATATLTISTTAPTKSDTAANSRPTALIYAAGGAVLVGLAFLGIPARKRRLRALFAVLFCLGLYTGLTACGGSGSSSGGNGGGKSSPGTTPGAYQITVTAIATNPNNSARVPLGATIINLTVQ